MMAHADDTLDTYRAMVLDEWTNQATIAGYRRWYRGNTIQLQPMTDMTIAAAQIHPGMQVLDLASGTGQPALTIARLVGPDGHVTVTDLSAGMLALAREHAAAEGLTNLIFQQVDAHTLPFPEASFDAVTSRIGVMYFVELQRALAEIRRVLKPGGQVAFTVWGPPDQGTYMARMMTPFFKRVAVPQPPLDAPQPFRFAAPGSLAAELERAGFRNVREELEIADTAWPGPPEEAWQMFYDVAVPLQPVFDSLPPDERQRAVDEVVAGLREGYDGTQTLAEVAMIAVAGMR